MCSKCAFVVVQIDVPAQQPTLVGNTKGNNVYFKYSKDKVRSFEGHLWSWTSVWLGLADQFATLADPNIEFW